MSRRGRPLDKALYTRVSVGLYTEKEPILILDIRSQLVVT